MFKKLLTRAVAPLPATNIMSVVLLIALFTAGYGVGVSQAGGALGTWFGDGASASPGVDGADLSAEMVAYGESELADARAETAGVEQVVMTALYEGVTIPLVAIGGRIAEVGAGVGYWVATTFGVTAAEVIGNALCVSMLGVVAYDIATDIRELEAGA